MPSRLRDEIKQTKPFTSLEQEAHLSLLRTAAAVAHASGDVYKAYDITPTQYNALRILRGAGAPGLCRNDIRQRLVTEVPDVTRLLDRMEDAGRIERERGNDDRRFVTTRITAKGLRVLDALEQPVLESHRAVFGHLGAKKLRALIDTLAALRAGL